MRENERESEKERAKAKREWRVVLGGGGSRSCICMRDHHSDYMCARSDANT